MNSILVNAFQTLDDDITALADAKAAAEATIDSLTGIIHDLRQPQPLLALTALEFATDWIQPANAGDTGGSSDKPSGTFVMVPGATFSAAGAYPYNNGYWYKKWLGVQASSLVQTLSVTFPTAADVAACQAIEFELQQSDGERVYNMAWQCPVRRTGFWRTFDYTTHKWEETTIPATTFVPGQRVDLIAKYLLTPDATTHVSLTIDGVEYPVNISRVPTAKASSQYLSIGFQLDSDSKTPPTPYKVFVRNINIHATKA